MALKSNTPETDNEADDAHNVCLDYDCQGKNDNIPVPIVVPADFARKLERERDELREAVRNLINVQGRHQTQIAMQRLIAILPENQQTQ